MALITCPNCGKQVSDKAAKCPHCGWILTTQPAQTEVKTPKSETTTPTKKHHKKWPIFVIISLCLAIVFAALWFFVYNHASKSSQEIEEESEQIIGDPKLLKVTNNEYDYSLAPQAGNTYEASNLCDGNRATAWAINLDNAIYDCDMLFGPTFSIKCKELSYIIVHNGYCKNEDSFKNNTRAARIVVYSYNERALNGDEHVLFDGYLSDNSKPQRLEMSPDKERKDSTKHIGIKFYPESDGGFYAGAKWNDLCISEIEFWGYE